MPEGDIADWSDADWRQWFSENVDMDGRIIEEVWSHHAHDSGPPYGVDEGLVEAFRVLWVRAQDYGPAIERWEEPAGGWESAFGRLSTEMKRKFYEGYRRESGVVDPPAGEIETPTEAEPETADSSDEVMDLLSDDEGGELWSGSPEGPGINISLPGGKVVTVPVETGRRNIRWPIIIGFGVVSFVLAGFILFTGNDSEEAAPGEEGAVAESGQEVASQDGESEPEQASSASLDVSFVDDLGDYVEREPFDPDPNPDPAADITLVSVRTEGDATIITLEFAAAGEDHTGLGLDARITPADGPIINMLRRPDGSAKVSDPPGGETLSARWLDADRLQLTLGNWTPDGGFELAVSTLVSSRGLYTIDEWVGQLTP